jgi:hypothetical protein
MLFRTKQTGDASSLGFRARSFWAKSVGCGDPMKARRHPRAQGGRKIFSTEY